MKQKQKHANFLPTLKFYPIITTASSRSKQKNFIPSHSGQEDNVFFRGKPEGKKPHHVRGGMSVRSALATQLCSLLTLEGIEYYSKVM